MSATQTLLMIAAVALGTAVTRYLPFLLFSGGRKTPGVVTYLGKVLPYAAMGMLVVYCFKDVRPLAAPHGLPELIASAAVVALHLWRRNTLLSIGAGTALYMFLVQAVF